MLAGVIIAYLQSVIQGWCNIPKSSKVISHINRIKDKNSMTILIAENAFKKIQHLFMVKMLKKFGLGGNFFNLIKSIYKKQQQALHLSLYLIFSPKILYQEQNKMSILILSTDF